MSRPTNLERDPELSRKTKDAAKLLFIEKGYYETSLRQIAEIVGVRAPTLIYHFETKENLYNLILEEFYDRLDEALLPVLNEGSDSTAQLVQAMGKLKSFHEKERAFNLLVVRELTGSHQLGAEVIRKRMLPILNRAEEVYRKLNPGISKKVPIRSIFLQTIVSYLVKDSLGSFGNELWNHENAFGEIFEKQFNLLLKWEN